MDSIDLQVLDAARRWATSGKRFALVTVAATWGSAPRPPGAWLALREDGAIVGSVSGGCVEDDLIERMRAGRIAAGPPFPLTYGVTRDEATRFGLPCGGTLELVIEPAPDPQLLDDLAQRVAAHQLAARSVDLASGAVTIADARRGDALQWNGSRLTAIHGPQWRLLIIGAGQLSVVLARMALALDFEVIVCDPREEYRAEWSVPGTRFVDTMPDDTVLAMQPDPHSAIVALTHDPKLDDMALLEALKSQAFYVGALGSRRNTAARKARLREHFDLSDAEVERLHGPVGLFIGSRTPAEIAVSILAEIIAVKRGVVAPVERQHVALADGCATG
ncbi:MAG: XdhC family protein [Sterolibacteriaceae bacterium]|nr:XdhC family protein [Candidatus Methylophosphatis haderslevensis]